MAGFQARLHALEGAHFRTEEQFATQRHLEKLVAQGKVSNTALVADSVAAGVSPQAQFRLGPAACCPTKARFGSGISARPQWGPRYLQACFRPR